LTALITPTLCPNISSFVAITNANKVVFDISGNYQKQTYRNRMDIYGANGLLQLNIPVIYSQKQRQLYKDVKIYNSKKWQANHWKSFESAYKTSPFFEFYEDELRPLYNKSFDFILDFNFEAFDIICDCLQLDLDTEKTNIFEKNPTEKTDFRALAERKSKGFILEPYTQVFEDKKGVIPNLSILDLLFNEGPNALNYLENQRIDYAKV